MGAEVKFSNRGMFFAGLIGVVVEVLLLGVLYKNVLDFDCSSTGREAVCLSISELPIRALCVAALLGILASSRAFAAIGARLTARSALALDWALVHVAGVTAIVAPLFFMSNDLSWGGFNLVLALWIGGAIAASCGAVFTVFRPATIMDAARQLQPLHWVGLALAFLAPDWARLVQRGGWDVLPLTDVTFGAVAFVLESFGETVMQQPDDRIMGIGSFIVEVGYQCSGIEGFGLVTLFIIIYLALFRDQLRLGRAIWAWPLGLVISFIFNVLRISLLIWIGAHVSPDFAINGFHSHAGWFFFTILALTIAVTVQAVPWFRAEPVGARSGGAAQRIGFWQDPATVQILPFIVLMAAVMVRSTVSGDPEALYPVQFLAMAAMGVIFAGAWARLGWRLDPLALLGGAAVAGVWLLLAERGLATEDRSTFWMVTRVLGTVLLVPVIEELFFRGYIIDQFRQKGSAVMLIAGIALSTVLFAALHGNWVGAVFAGLVFAALAVRPGGRLSDAIVAHMLANALVAAAAFASGDWGLI